MYSFLHADKERERERERQTDRERQRQRDRETETETERDRDRQRQTQTDRQTDRWGRVEREGTGQGMLVSTFTHTLETSVQDATQTRHLTKRGAFFIDLSIVCDSLRLHQLQKGTGDDDSDVVAEDDGGSDNCNDDKRRR